MKIVISILSILIIGLISCSNSTDPVNNEDKVSCQIDGTQWTADGTFIGVELGTFRKQLRILGFKTTDTIEFVLRFEPFEKIDVGNYLFENAEEFFAIYHNSGEIDTARSGYINLTIIDEDSLDITKGTFEFEVKTLDDNIHQIKNGKIELYK